MFLFHFSIFHFPFPFFIFFLSGVEERERRKREREFVCVCVCVCVCVSRCNSTYFSRLESFLAVTKVVLEYEEWGNPSKNLEVFHYIRSYDPYLNIPMST